MGSLARVILRRWRWGPVGKIRRFCLDPSGTQQRVLRWLLTSAANTEWGRRLEFARLAREPDVVRAYQQSVPVHPYEAFHEDHLRVLRGERDICWPGRFRYVALSSSTLSRGHVLPASEATIRNDLCFGRAVFLSYLADTGRVGCLRGGLVTLPGRVESPPEYPGVMMGDMTGCIADYCATTGMLRRHLAQRLSLPEEIRNLGDFDRKAAAIADYYLNRDVRTLVLMPSWGLALIDRVIERYGQTRSAKVSTLGEIWPNLQLIVAGGVPLSTYRRAIEQRLGPAKVDFVEVYSASEASLAMQTSQDDPSLLLHLDNGVFFEFIRQDEAHQPQPRRWWIGNVEPGVNYQVLLSTCSGLWTYPLGDVVRFERIIPHKLTVAGRMGELMDSVGEYLFAEEVRGAIRHACEATGSRVREFHLAPRPRTADELHAHQWLVEFDRAPADLSALAAALDAHLCRTSPTYAEKREHQCVGPPEVIALPGGIFRRWLDRSRPQSYGHAKVPLLDERRTVADSLLELAAASK